MMPAVTGSNRRFVFLGATCAIVLLLWYLTSGGDPAAYASQFSSSSSSSRGTAAASALHVDETVALDGRPIAQKLGNETLKAELGRAAWKVFHTTLARFPERPTGDESAALRTYIHLFQKLYPCGECADHFGALLQQFPPQVSSRNVAAGWGCHIHNKVNEQLGKDPFDCAKIGDFYDCGCGDDEKRAMNARAVEPLSTQQDPLANSPPSSSSSSSSSSSGSGSGRALNLDPPPGVNRKDVKTDRTYVNMGFVKYEMTREQMRALQQTGRSLSGDIYKPTEEFDDSNLGLNQFLQDAARGSVADAPPPKKQAVEWDDTEDPWKVSNYLPDSV